MGEKMTEALQIDENDWQYVLSAVEFLRDMERRTPEQRTEIAWRHASNLAALAKRMNNTLEAGRRALAQEKRG